MELLRRLRSDPRAGVAALARGMGMSAPAVRERLARLEEAGVIVGYRLEIDPRAVGYPIAAFIRVRPIPGQVAKVVEIATQMPEVTECHRVTGEDCFILKVHFEGLEVLDRLLDRFLVCGHTTTSLVQSSPIPARDLPLPDERAGR